MAEKVEGVRVSLGTGLRCELAVRGHTLVADEPVELGGQDVGPTPGEILLMSLGGCTAMTLRMYADRKGWPLEGVEVKLASYREEGEPVIERKIRLQGDLDEDQRERLAYIANRCPVHRLITENPRVVDI